MSRIGVRSETCTPRWVDSAMIGPAATRATAEGSRATNGASRARKVRNSRATMNRTESSSVRVWMWPFWFCSSTDAGQPAGQVHGQAGGRARGGEGRPQRGHGLGRGRVPLGGRGDVRPRPGPAGPGRWPTPPGRGPRSPGGPSAWPARRGRWRRCRRRVSAPRRGGGHEGRGPRTVVDWNGAASSWPPARWARWPAGTGSCCSSRRW